jgi:hypothetical protein
MRGAGEADHPHSRRPRRCHSGNRILDHQGIVRLCLKDLGGMEEDIRRRLAATLANRLRGEHVRAKTVPEFSALQRDFQALGP